MVSLKRARKPRQEEAEEEEDEKEEEEEEEEDVWRKGNKTNKLEDHILPLFSPSRYKLISVPDARRQIASNS